MNTAKPKSKSDIFILSVFGKLKVEKFYLFLFLSPIAVTMICMVLLGIMCDFKFAGKIGFAMIFLILSVILTVFFILALFKTWRRNTLRISVVILFFSTFIASSLNGLNFSLIEMIFISMGVVILPLLTTFCFYRNEEMEKLRKRGFFVENPIQSMTNGIGKITVFRDEDMNLILVDENYKEII